MADYVHGYGTPKRERLVAQAEPWGERLIGDGTKLPPATHLLEVGCGAGAVLASLGQEFPDVLVPGGAITAIEVDYSTVRASPSSAFEAWFVGWSSR